MGSHSYTPDETHALLQSLSSFSHISVREDNTANMLENLLKRRIDHNLDPTLLLTKSDWEDLLGIEKHKNSKPYILISVLKVNNFLKQIINYVSDALDLDVIVINQDPFLNFKPTKHIRDAGPKEFVTLFSSASFIVTDSYHGMAFSINFN